MRPSALVLGSLAAVLSLLVMSAPASAFDELNGCYIEFAPMEMNQGQSTHFTVTLHNNNNRSLTVTTITVQIYNAPMFGMSDEYKMYQLSTADGVIPAGGSKQFGHDGVAPDYFGSCSVMVTISGILEGSENISIGLFTASTVLNPSLNAGLLGLGLLLLIVPAIVIVAVVILLIVLMSKRKQPIAGPPMVCPGCGAPKGPNAQFCPQCGRKN